MKTACAVLCVLLVGPDLVTAFPDTSDAKEVTTARSTSAGQSSDPTEPPIELTKYSYARFLAGTSTNTRFVTTTVSTTVTCISKIANVAPACPTGKRRRRRYVRAIYSPQRSSLLDSSLLEEDYDLSERDVPVREGRLLFNAATTFTTLTFTQNVAGAKTVSVSVSCAPNGMATLCY